MIKQGGDWNSHHGVGRTLLDNWVEERAVGPLIEQERADIKAVSKNGHKDILVNNKNWTMPVSTTREAQEQIALSSQSNSNVKTRREMLEKELLKMAIEQQKPAAADISTKKWISTTKQDFTRSDFAGPRPLGDNLDDRTKLAKYAQPITFWSDFAVKGNGTTICSTATEFLTKDHKCQDPSCSHVTPVKFGKQSGFSTLIQDFDKSPHKP
ncbi:hypothetical protein EDD86DRAFT_185454 [Gorgonomyces haynaldii]|nr:hypothetical protein EDD86DRAFT_185454 [Gorgonomyces haynaldii]